MPIISQTQYNELRPNEQKYYAEMMARANQQANEDYQPYTPQRVAGIPNELRAAQAGAINGMERESPLFASAEAAARNGARSFNQNYQEYMNPYQQTVLRQLADEGNRNFQESILPALEARFIKLGQHGSSKHTDLKLRAARDFQRELLGKQQQALAMGYQQASQAHNAQQGRELESASQLSNIGVGKQASRFSDLGALENVGRYKQQQEQSILDAQYQEFLRQINHPQDRLAAQVANMHGMPHQGVNQAYYQTPATPQANIASGFGNLAGGLLASRLMGVNR